MNGSYEDQVNRMLRSYNKLPLCSLLIQEKCTSEIMDSYIHFFQDCYHLKDWIKNDTKFCQNRTRAKVEKFVNKNEALIYIASITNATKHLILDEKHKRNILDMDFESLGSNHDSLLVGSIAKDNFYTASCLAAEGVRAWRTFLNENDLKKIEIADRSKLTISGSTPNSILYTRPNIT